MYRHLSWHELIKGPLDAGAGAFVPARLLFRDGGRRRYMNKIIYAFILGVLIFSAPVFAQQSQPLNENRDLVSREDPVITTDVRNKITQDEMLRGLIVDVVTKDGIVTLTGTVASQAQADRAVELARGIPGAVSVTNKLKINAPAASDVGTPTLQEKDQIVEKGQKELDEAADMTGDANIINEAKVKLAADDLVKSRNIQVLSTDGVIVLRGSVRTSEEQEQAIRLVNSVPGVREVRSELRIDPAAK
jgi:hyperosmotically inducible protein